MGMIVRFFDGKGNTVKICSLTSRFMRHSTHRDLHRVSHALNELESSKLFQILVVGPKVSIKSHDKIV